MTLFNLIQNHDLTVSYDSFLGAFNIEIPESNATDAAIADISGVFSQTGPFEIMLVNPAKFPNVVKTLTFVNNGQLQDTWVPPVSHNL